MGHCIANPTRRGQAASVVSLAGLILFAGCGMGGGQASHRERENSNLGSLVLIYCQYLASSRGVPPKSEDDLRAFAEALPQNLGKRLGADQFDGLITSPRDKLPYIVVYEDSPRAKGLASGVIIYEQKGVDGMRWVGRSTGTTSELSESELRELVPDA